MDNIGDPSIYFDDEGICNYYYEYKDAVEFLTKRDKIGQYRLEDIVEEIKKDGKGRKYDCIVGVSGGVDSTYLAYLAYKMGLRVLCVHLDNGWNSEIAVKNIENLVRKCQFDLYTYVIDWEEFKDIQLSYFKANVIDIEAITDIAIMTSLQKACYEMKIKHLILGLNFATEVTIPGAWMCKNLSNLKDIHKRYGKVPLKTFPMLNPFSRRIIARFTPFKTCLLLNYIDYNVTDARELIKREIGWTDYGGKHYESVFTRFYQGYILPTKFKVDKRKAHYSNLIFSGQMSKEEALDRLKIPIYPEKLFQRDYDFVLKKLGFSHEEFEKYLKAPAAPHSEFALSLSLFDEYPLLKPFRKIFGK
jgi:N-acetyl sugar amidotransferase